MLGEIDYAAKRHKAARGETVLLEQMFNHLQIVGRAWTMT